LDDDVAKEVTHETGEFGGMMIRIVVIRIVVIRIVVVGIMVVGIILTGIFEVK